MDPFDRLLVQIVADAERVGARGDRAHGRLLDADEVGHRAHLQCVADHEPVVAELAAQEPRDDRRAQCCRLVVERGNDEVRGHDRADAGVDRGSEGLEGAVSQSPEAIGSARCESTAVSPWPGKCLAQATTPCACVPRT